MKIILFTISFTIFSLLMVAQLPYVSNPTVIPQNPTTNSFIKIITKVTTPNQGIIVDNNTYSLNGTQIWIKGCYWNGSLTSTQNFIDTIVIGQLPAGNYQCAQIARLSSTQQHCTIIDSSSAALLFQVSQLTNINYNQLEKGIKLFPNPCYNKLNVLGMLGEIEIKIYSLNGNIVKNNIQNASELDVSDLPSGMYILEVRDINYNKKQFIKFVKSVEAD